MNESEPGARERLKLLLVVWEGLDASDLEPAGDSFWPASLARRGSRAALAGHKADQAEPFWRGCLSLSQEDQPDQSLFHMLSQRGLSLGLVNLPWPLEPQGDETFFIGRAPAGQAAPLVHPPELALDLADYASDPPAPHRYDSSKLSRGLTDLALAEQAAVCRIRFEHALRLGLERRPEMLAVCLGGHDLIKTLGPRTSRRRGALRAQLSHYGASLEERLNPRAVALLSDGNVGRPGFLVVRSKDLAPGGDLGPLSWSRVAGVLANAASASQDRAEEGR